MNKIELLAHNIRSLWNVGSFFRSADCFAVEKIYLSGYTGTPPRREINKTAIGAEEWIPWEYTKNPVEVIQKLKERGYRIVGLEITDTSKNIYQYTPPEKICLLVGNEVQGISDELLEICDDIVHIPIMGKKESLNVSVATGIALSVLS